MSKKKKSKKKKETSYLTGMNLADTTILGKELPHGTYDPRSADKVVLRSLGIIGEEPRRKKDKHELSMYQ
ncbi:MAG: hypothetical protein ACE5J7_02420 [Candidatus Aenigmatarchaeota archaeon]